KRRRPALQAEDNGEGSGVSIIEISDPKPEPRAACGPTEADSVTGCLLGKHNNLQESRTERETECGFQDRFVKPLGHLFSCWLRRDRTCAIASRGEAKLHNLTDAMASIDSPTQASPHFRQLRSAISSYLDAEVGSI